MMRLVKISLSLILFQTFAYATPTAQELLDEYAKTVDKTHTSYITQSQIDINSYHKYNGEWEYLNGRKDRYLIQELRCDGEKMKQITQKWGHFFNGTQKYFRPEEQKDYSSYTYDGDKRYQYLTGGDEAGRVIIETKLPATVTDFLNTSLAYGDHISQCFGYLGGDVERFDHILKKAVAGRISVKEEDFNGMLHYVIDAETDRGKYRIWINPEKGYNYSKAAVVRNAGDFYMGQGHKVPPESVRRFVIENTEFKEVDGIWIPVKAKVEINDKLPDGAYINMKKNMVLTSITINPDHNALGSFLLTDIREGAMVFFANIPGKYIWQGGKPIADVSKEVIAELDRMAKEIAQENKTDNKPPAEEGVIDDTSITVDTILSKYKKTLKQLTSFYCEGEVSGDEEKSPLCQYACNDIQFSVKVSSDRQVKDGFVWDGVKTVRRSDNSVLASTDKKKAYQLLATVYPGAALLGYMNGQPDRIDELLLTSSKKATISVEEVYGKKCYVIKALIGKNMYQVWFSPEHGYHIAKVEIQAESKQVYLLDHVQFRKMEDVWVPVSCAVTDSSRQYTYERTKIDLKPDFEKMKAFELPIANGTPIAMENKDGQYVWQDGHVVDKEGKDAFK